MRFDVSQYMEDKKDINTLKRYVGAKIKIDKESSSCIGDRNICLDASSEIYIASIPIENIQSVLFLYKIEEEFGPREREGHWQIEEDMAKKTKLAINEEWLKRHNINEGNYLCWNKSITIVDEIFFDGDLQLEFDF